MRISIEIKDPDHKSVRELNDLKNFFESHTDGQEDYFVATDQRRTFVFQFTYTWVLGCHKLFLYNEEYDGLLDFFAEDFQTFGEWLYPRLDDIFGVDYDILF